MRKHQVTAASRLRLHLIYLVATSLAFVACSGDLRDIQTISFTDSPRLESTSDLEGIKPDPLIATSTPTRARQSATATPTSMSGSIRVIKVTEKDRIAGVRWSSDGQSVVYATWAGHRGIVEEWWEYRVSTGEHHLTDPPFELDPQIWTQLEASYVDEAFIWFRGGLSPSGTQVVYNRLPPGGSYTPAPDEFDLPPYEAWTAESDGSNAVRLQNCPHISQAIWLDQERKILLNCSYEGGAGVNIVDVDGSSSMDPLEGLTVSDWVALSPDGTKLAFSDAFGTLQIAFLDDGEIQPVAQWGYVPNWAPDSRRLYYQHLREFTDHFADIRVYDLDTGTDTLLISSSIHASDGKEVSIPVGTFIVSPLENAAAFEFRGLWLVTWSQ
jgi:hypothetical protein